MLQVPTELTSAIASRPVYRKGGRLWRSYTLRASYKNFVDFAYNEASRHTLITPSPLQEKFNTITAIDGKTTLEMLSFASSKIRFMRSLKIENNSMQVLDLTAFPRPEYDLPIFCANFFSTSHLSIVVLDLNPLHDVIKDKEYKQKHYDSLMPLWIKYAESFPWGGQLTAESIKFFSPIVIWSKFTPSKEKKDALYAAFEDYFKTWVNLIQRGEKETKESNVHNNQEAQHRYLTWRAEKDPGHQLLKKLIGESAAKDVLNNFLFCGIDELGSKKFLDYFPEYQCEDGSVNAKRSIMGKSYEDRPWTTLGEFTGTFVDF